MAPLKNSKANLLLGHPNRHGTKLVAVQWEGGWLSFQPCRRIRRMETESPQGGIFWMENLAWILFVGGIWKSLKMREVFDLSRWRRMSGFRRSLEGRKADRNVESKYWAPTRFLTRIRIPLRIN